MTVPLLERVVAVTDEGRRADQVVSVWLDEPRARTQQRLAAGEVLVGGEAAGKSRRLRAGDRVMVATPPLAPAPEAPQPVAVRWDDEHLAVVSKPAGMVVHAGAGVRGGTLVDALMAMQVPLAATGGDPLRPGIVHRLDRGTSGLLVIAKTDEAYLGMAALLRTHDIERSYTALVEGVPDPPRATVDAPIARSVAQRTRFAVDPGGRPAVTHYDLLEAHARGSALDVRLETGRTHQVRVHLSAVGHPVIADWAYGGSAALGASLGLERPALHARLLAFVHPVSGRHVQVEEPLPDDLAGALKRLRCST